MKKKVVLLATIVGATALGCQPSGSAAERCHAANAFARAGRELQGKPNAAANAAEDARCEVVGLREDENRREQRADARARKAEEEQAERARSEGYRQLDAQLEAIRRSPTVPELGATIAEIRVICTQQRGEFVNRSSKIGCRIRSQVIFACTLDDDSRSDRCDGFYETADLARSRKAVEARLGLPTRETVSAEGFRVFEWSNSTETLVLTMYARGVRMTTQRRPNDEPAP